MTWFSSYLSIAPPFGCLCSLPVSWILLTTGVSQTMLSYIRTNPIRFVLTVCVFVIEFFWLMAYVKSANWIQRSFAWKVFFFFKMLIAMAVFEVIRWTDVMVKRFYKQDEQQTANTGPAASPVDTKYIERNRGYK